MELVLRFETSELELLLDKTSYNHVCHKLKIPKFGCTHLYEIYDDVADYPLYEIGVFNKDRFETLITGEGDPIPEGKQSWGGIWVEIEVFYPEDNFRLYNLS